MSAYTEQYEIELRNARRALRDEKVKRKVWMTRFVLACFAPVPFVAGSIVLFYLEHLRPYTDIEVMLAKAGQSTNGSFYAWMGGFSLTAGAVLIAFACYLVTSNHCIVPSKAELTRLADAVDDAQSDLDDAILEEQEQAVKQYQPPGD